MVVKVVASADIYDAVCRQAQVRPADSFFYGGVELVRSAYLPRNSWMGFDAQGELVAGAAPKPNETTTP